MAAFKLIYIVDDQNVRCINNRTIISDSDNYIYAQVILSDTVHYDVLDKPKITAVFWKDEATEYVEIDSCSGIFAIPHEYVSTPGEFKISFKISYENTVITTTKVIHFVKSFGYDEITKNDAYQILLERVKKLEESIGNSDNGSEYEERISELEKSVSNNTTSLAAFETKMVDVENKITDLTANFEGSMNSFSQGLTGMGQSLMAVNQRMASIEQRIQNLEKAK